MKTLLTNFPLSLAGKTAFTIILSGLAISTFARNEVIYPPVLEVRQDYQFLAQAKVGTRQYCVGNWNVGADKMESVPLKCENSQSVSAAIKELELNGWEAKSHTLAPHVTDFSPNGVPGYKRLTVVMIKTRVVPYFSDRHQDRYALPGEDKPAGK